MSKLLGFVPTGMAVDVDKDVDVRKEFDFTKEVEKPDGTMVTIDVEFKFRKKVSKTVDHDDD